MNFGVPGVANLYYLQLKAPWLARADPNAAANIHSHFYLCGIFAQCIIPVCSLKKERGPPSPCIFLHRIACLCNEITTDPTETLLRFAKTWIAQGSIIKLSLRTWEVLANSYSLIWEEQSMGPPKLKWNAVKAFQAHSFSRAQARFQILLKWQLSAPQTN